MLDEVKGFPEAWHDSYKQVMSEFTPIKRWWDNVIKSVVENVVSAEGHEQMQVKLDQKYGQQWKPAYLNKFHVALEGAFET